MKGTSKPRLPHLRPAHPHLRVRGWFLSENAAMPPGQQVKVHKSASFVDILEVCKFTTFCHRKGYWSQEYGVKVFSGTHAAHFTRMENFFPFEGIFSSPKHTYSHCQEYLYSNV